MYLRFDKLIIVQCFRAITLQEDNFKVILTFIFNCFII